MQKNIHKNDKGNWVMPLPFRSENVKMPNNRNQAESRLTGLLKILKRKPQMEKDYFEFMAKIFEKGHAIPAPNAQLNRHENNGNVWYLPHFGVYHPRKPTQIRVVFDSSAEFKGVSLNKELLTGPDLTSSLFGVLLRFRHHNTAAMCDVEQMFHSFKVDQKHQNFLRFLWYRNNDPLEEIIAYQMTVHLFGNGPSPAVATFGLQKTALDGEEHYGEEPKEFIHRNFYVDDGLVSRATPEETITLIKNAQAALATANIRLHKVISNSVEVMEALPADDRAKDVRDLDLRKEALPTQRSLGVQWNLQDDKFTFKVSTPDKPFTRRGVLSVVNSIYDPMGLAVPVTLKGKLLLQKLVSMGKTRNGDNLGWDDPLPEDLMRQWKQWKDALPNLQNASLPRCLHPRDFGTITRAEVHAFSDASEDAIGVAVYLRLINHNNDAHVSFLFGQSKVAPIKITSIPRLELCGAVLVVQAVRRILSEIDLEIHEVTFYTDSKVVLGYIHNEGRRFYTYVANRVQIIRSVSKPDQWKFVETTNNPADLATRGHHLSELLIRHYHETTYHQGRQITHGAVRQAGYWVISGHGAVTKVLNACVTCKKSRGMLMTQHMADLPKDRTEPSPPFTNVGIDVFGPWYVRTRKLRGGAANSKRWGLVLTCLSSRAIHIELLESMDASSFICALRRFFAIRGPATRIKCDRGTNFVGGKSELEQSLTETDQQKIQRYSTEQGCEWIFNPPHASHFGGVWERQIRTIRSILDAMLTQIGSSQLTHELLSTLMAEVTGIVNSRPIAAVPSDADEVQPLSPSMLLTAKERPLTPPPGDFVPEDLYARRRWRRVQYLADQFWTRWKREYLQNLQRRAKWQELQPNLAVGDKYVKNEETRRNNWPLGKVTKAIRSEDGAVRKAEVFTTHAGKGGKTLLRPIGQLVFVMSTKKDNKA
ncbi:hypothetical protein QZH41_013131 [Actinostola sp. cb2023]|nr:hypothetical protein QZH41_013131 [Actinostola sp. cb2023]